VHKLVAGSHLYRPDSAFAAIRWVSSLQNSANKQALAPSASVRTAWCSLSPLSSVSLQNNYADPDLKLHSRDVMLEKLQQASSPYQVRQ
jgi:hypothetical protein